MLSDLVKLVTLYTVLMLYVDNDTYQDLNTLEYLELLL